MFRLQTAKLNQSTTEDLRATLPDHAQHIQGGFSPAQQSESRLTGDENPNAHARLMRLRLQKSKLKL
jgi:hypothetical protein